MTETSEAYFARLVRERDAEIERLRAALKPITMQDIRLCAGEGKLSTQTMLDAANAVLRLRVHEQLATGDEK